MTNIYDNDQHKANRIFKINLVSHRAFKTVHNSVFLDNFSIKFQKLFNLRSSRPGRRQSTDTDCLVKCIHGLFSMTSCYTFLQSILN